MAEDQPVKKQKLEEATDVVNAAQVDSSATQAFTQQALMKEGRTSEQREAINTFGPTQGPAGSVVPEPPSASEAETGQSEDQPSEFEPGIVAIEDRLHNGDQVGADAALRAADRAKVRGSSDDAMLDALEAAETAYDSARGSADPAKGSAAQRLSSRLEGEGPGASAASPGRNGSKGGFSVDPGNRAKIRDKLLASAQKSAALAQLPRDKLEEHASQMEAACHDSSSSRPVYFSKAGNIARLVSKATSAGELTEILLAARGQAKEASFADAPTRDTVTGLQGTVMK